MINPALGETNVKKPINICEQYPEYWEYDGKPIMLLGGSKEENPFQIPDLIEHLGLLHSVGGNYTGCTMSSRYPGDVEPFEKKDGIFDLNVFSEEYWKRFRNFLKYTYKLDIIIQLVVWDSFTFKEESWQKNAFNLQNNTIMKYQKAFVDKLMSYSLEYPHVLYCIDNIASGAEEWVAFWAEYIKGKAAGKGLNVHITEMWEHWDMLDQMYNRTFDHPELYSFCDISQNNHVNGAKHQDAISYVKERTKNRARPLNNVKIYGSYTYETPEDALERFWRSIFGKCASVNFHSNDLGLGLTPLAQKHILSARKLTYEIKIFECQPHNEFILQSEENQAYCLADPGRVIAVYFTGCSEILLDTSSLNGDLLVKWLDINNARDGEIRVYGKAAQLRLKAGFIPKLESIPYRGDQVVIVIPV